MPDPAYIQLPSDAPDNKNKVRSFSLVDDEGNTVLQQVAVLSDAAGNVVGLRAGHLPVADEATTDLLEAICRRLDVIAAALDPHYTPDDQFGLN